MDGWMDGFIYENMYTPGIFIERQKRNVFIYMYFRMCLFGRSFIHVLVFAIIIPPLTLTLTLP